MRKSEMEQRLKELERKVRLMSKELEHIGIIDCYGYTTERGMDIKYLNELQESVKALHTKLSLVLDYFGLCYEESHMTEPRLVACTDEGESDEQD
jgi:hypothetical protein